jgi:hypothetical protein
VIVVLLPVVIAALQLPPVAPRVTFEGPAESRWAIEVCHLGAAAPLEARDPSPPVVLWSIPLP